MDVCKYNPRRFRQLVTGLPEEIASQFVVLASHKATVSQVEMIGHDELMASLHINVETVGGGYPSEQELEDLTRVKLICFHVQGYKSNRHIRDSLLCPVAEGVEEFLRQRYHSRLFLGEELCVWLCG